MRHADSIKVADSLKFVTPKGKVVYGGGGITPDVFVPKDTSIASETLKFVSRSGYMGYFVFEFLEKRRKDFEKITFLEFERNYEVDTTLAEEFIAYASLSEARIDLSEYTEDLKKAIKANIAQQLYGSNAFEYILNQGDPMLEKVLRLEGLLPVDETP